MNFLITGGTGFIGNRLAQSLVGQGHHVFILTRTPDEHTHTEQITFLSYDTDFNRLPPICGVVNLAGESIFGYWSGKKKEKIRQSRVETTKKLVKNIQNMENKPQVFINGSAVGYYGTSKELTFSEKTTKPGKDFLSSVVVEWEHAAKEIETLGIRTVYARIGMVLDQKEGSFPLMALPVKLFIGGKFGDGEQWISWVHIEDAVGLLEYCLLNEDIEGPINVTAPEPKRNKDFYKLLTTVNNRPYWFQVPAVLIRMILGEMAILITEGQYVYPKKAEKHGYAFRYRKLKSALKSMQ